MKIKTHTDATIRTESKTYTSAQDGKTIRTDSVIVGLPDGRTISVDLLQVEDGAPFGTIWMHETDSTIADRVHFNRNCFDLEGR